MSKGFTFSLEGSGLLAKRLEKLSKSVQEDVAVEIEDSAQNIRNKALGRAPADMATLRQGISAKPLAPLTWEVSSNARYSAYVEFGTGQYAASYVPSLPPDIQEYAKQFYVNGKGRMPARPFLFNSYLEEQVRLIKAIKDILKDGGRK